jgi:membrane-associated phospholipid phosphatase
MSDGNVMLLQASGREEVLPSFTATEGRSLRARLLIATVLALLAVVTLLIHYFMPVAWNVSATLAAQSLSLPGLHELMRVISGFGNAPKVIAITVIALVACNRRREAVFLTWSGLGGWFVAMQLKQLFATPRPAADLVAVFHQWPTGSFPSGHLVFYVCYFGFLFFVAREKLLVGSLFRRLVLLLLALLIGLVGLSRVYLGEHWLSDLPGSYFLGGIWLALSLKLYRGWTSARQQQRRLTHSFSNRR